MRLAGGAGSSAFLLLTMHHVVEFLMGILTCVSADVAVFKLSSTLLFGWAWEWTLFLSFLGVRALDATQHVGQHRRRCETLYYYRVFVQYCLVALALLYFASRCIEIVALGQIIACGLHRNTARGYFSTAAVLSVVAAGIQLQAGLAIPSLRRRRLGAMAQSSDGESLA